MKRKILSVRFIAVFNKYRVYDFIESSYDALHTYGGDEIAWNISEYMRRKGSVYAQ